MAPWFQKVDDLWFLTVECLWILKVVGQWFLKKDDQWFLKADDLWFLFVSAAEPSGCLFEIGEDGIAFPLPQFDTGVCKTNDCRPRFQGQTYLRKLQSRSDS